MALGGAALQCRQQRQQALEGTSVSENAGDHTKGQLYSGQQMEKRGPEGQGNKSTKSFAEPSMQRSLKGTFSALYGGMGALSIPTGPAFRTPKGQSDQWGDQSHRTWPSRYQWEEPSDILLIVLGKMTTPEQPTQEQRQMPEAFCRRPRQSEGDRDAAAAPAAPVLTSEQGLPGPGFPLCLPSKSSPAALLSSTSGIFEGRTALAINLCFV
ncbi:hypothetical protein H920_12253 [Fukomys damarensis]|uniref:Uncharacterized protein n=1 Tax=Fukomys damarensis TaxID=885580 RepID=A0A091D7Y1_FUKDA|nr:hypothetical protein H920_12253 [Fukomys damarensis]